MKILICIQLYLTMIGQGSTKGSVKKPSSIFFVEVLWNAPWLGEGSCEKNCWW